MGNNITELVFIIDKSGSMSGMEDDTTGGYNSMIEKQKRLEGKAYVSTVFFSNTSEVIHDRIPIDSIKPLQKNDFETGGCTALLDAIGDAVHHIGNVHKYARSEDVPEHTLFIITTDGMENASHNYTSDKVRHMIQRQEEKYGWEFIFVAANIDAVETAGKIGIRKERAADYRSTKEGTRSIYEAVECAVTEIRCSKEISSDWKNKLNRE